jgi:hypothetical protein
MSNTVRCREFQRHGGKLTRPRDEWRGKQRATYAGNRSSTLSSAVMHNIARQQASAVRSSLGQLSGMFAGAVKAFQTSRGGRGQ